MRILAALFCFLALPLHAQSDPVSRSWNEPVAPFRIAGNLWYVGASDITSFLLTSDEGHVLIDGGFVETAPQILANIATLGFRVEDVKVLLSTHAHYDHAGGLNAIRRATGARLLASRGDTPLLSRGGRDDPQFGDRYPFERTYPDGMIADRERVTVGDIVMTAHVTPGHTPGCTTWETTVRDGAKRLDVVIVCSVSIPRPYRLTGNPRYPDAAGDYRRSFARLHELKPDIFAGSHGGFFELKEKIALMRADASRNPFLNADEYRTFVAASEERFEQRLAAR